MREIYKKDNFGRVKRVEYFDDTMLVSTEEMSYLGNSHNPIRIIYKKREKGHLVRVKEEVYKFKNNQLKSLILYLYIKKKRYIKGKILYFFSNNLLKRIEYYKYNERLKKLFIFGLDQYEYKNRKLTGRRIIEYKINSKNNKSMQIAQYVATYENKKIKNLKIWILDKKSKKIVEKVIKNSILASVKILKIEKFYILTSRGKNLKNNK